MKALLLSIAMAVASSTALAAQQGDYLVKFAAQPNAMKFKMMSALPVGSKVTDMGFKNWGRVQIPRNAFRSFGSVQLKNVPGVLYVQPNFKVRLLEQPGVAEIKAYVNSLQGGDFGQEQDEAAAAAKDNPAIPGPKTPGTGDDPNFNKQWGMIDIGTQKAWLSGKGRSNVVVAVIDTGIDYTHEDLVENLWRNPGESGTDAQGRDKATNGVDDDGNGYIDDTIGWDFVSNDNKPYDLSVSPIELLFGGGNPGHGTHCAGNVAARGFNGKGISGVAPNVSIMGIRFLSEKGEGTTEGAVQSILYAVNNGATVTSNSWGSEGEDPADGANNQALRDAIQYAQEKGVLFIAAAGNGRSNGMTNPVGYDNDTDAKPAVPASYPHDIIISVAALDSSNNLGTFSNFGVKTVDIGAPGVKIYSTTVGSTYNDMVIDLPQFGIQASWDGTSMATPHVAGAAALYISSRPNATWVEVKNAILKSATPVSGLSNKLLTGGKLNVENMLNF